MEPFDIDRARKGSSVCTRSGDDVRILCVDRNGDYPICGIIDPNIDNLLACFTSDGRYRYPGYPYPTGENCFDLFMKKKKEDEIILTFMTDFREPK